MSQDQINFSRFLEAATDGCFSKIIVPKTEKHNWQYLTCKFSKMYKKYLLQGSVSIKLQVCSFTKNNFFLGIFKDFVTFSGTLILINKS